jgi:hypothetical protein
MIGLDSTIEQRYLFGMSRNYAAAERRYWLQARARGKNRFVLREILTNVFICLVVSLVVDIFEYHWHLSVSSVLRDLPVIILPIGLLGGYLSGIWRWRDFEKKHSE